MSNMRWENPLCPYWEFLTSWKKKSWPSAMSLLVRQNGNAFGHQSHISCNVICYHSLAWIPKLFGSRISSFFFFGGGGGGRVSIVTFSLHCLWNHNTKEMSFNLSFQNGIRDPVLSVAGPCKVLMVWISSWGHACVHRGNLLRADRVQEGKRELYSLWAVASSFLTLFNWWNLLFPLEHCLSLLSPSPGLSVCIVLMSVVHCPTLWFSLILKWLFPSQPVVI